MGTGAESGHGGHLPAGDTLSGGTRNARAVVHENHEVRGVPCKARDIIRQMIP